MKVSLWAEIRRLHEVECLSQAEIARRLHCSHRTGPQGVVDGIAAGAETRAAGRHPRPLPATDRRAPLAKYPGLSAVRVKEEISRGEEGYRGTVYPVRRYLCRVRPSRGRVYQEVFYEPGEALQVDWGDCGRLVIGQTVRRVSVFVAVLCYSRMCYIEFSLSQRKADFYRGVVHALEFFQGSPRKLIVDNLKAAVLNGRCKMPVSIPTSSPSAATLIWNRSPVRHAIRNPKGSSRGASATPSKAAPWRAAARS